ncbi:hypothetical protein SK128_007834, partial [Halocaridina rubra]
MTCTTAEECDVGQVGSIPSCSFGSTFCLAKGGCVYGGCYDHHNRPTLDNNIQSCPRGTVFCLESGVCQKSCIPPTTRPLKRSSRTGRRRGVGCPPGSTWCLVTGRCVVHGECFRKSSSAILSSRTGVPLEICEREK